MLQTMGQTDAYRWSTMHTLQSVNGSVQNGVVVIELEGQGGHTEEAYKIKHRLLLPPGTPWYIAEMVQVQNNGATPLRIKSLFFRLHNDFTSLPDKQPPGLWGAPVAACWLDEAGGRFLGALAPRASGMQIYFYFNEHKGQHPDARYEFKEPVVLAPGASYTPPTSVYLYCLAGRGSSQTWREIVFNADFMSQSK